MYDPKSRKAEDFINHQEILDSLAYADAHKNGRHRRHPGEGQTPQGPDPPGGLGAAGL